MVGIEDLICVVEVISSGDLRSGPFERHTIKSVSGISEVSYWTRGSCKGGGLGLVSYWTRGAVKEVRVRVS